MPNSSALRLPVANHRPDPVRSAKRAGLRYVDDRSPGIRRLKQGKGFRYLNAKGKPVNDAATLARIRALVIPPAWTDVWICPDPSGHIQVTGRDARGRKQYRYHTRFREHRDATKYEKIFEFAEALPKIRARCARDLARHDLSRERVLALLVTLLDTTLIRIGNEEYARTNQSFGLTTLRDRHARIRGSQLEFSFRGKSGKDRQIRMNDARLARVVKRCQDLPGDILFQYVDEQGAVRSVGSGDVNNYLRSITSQDFTAKDFRTWGGTVLAAVALHTLGAPTSATGAKKAIVEAVKNTAAALGNTPSVCRKCYVHPGVMDAYTQGNLMVRLVANAAAPQAARSSRHGLRPDEKAVLGFLKAFAKSQARKGKESGENLASTLQKSLATARRRAA